MSIYYTMISRGDNVLVDHADAPGNFEQATASILPNVSPNENTRRTYASQGYHFHVIVEDGLIYLCIADASLGKRIPYAFLHEVKRQFSSGALKTRAMVCNAYELRRDFSQVLSTQLDRYNRGEFDDPDLSAIQRAQKEVEDVKGIMTRNIEKVLSRGEELGLLTDVDEKVARREEKRYLLNEKAEDAGAAAKQFMESAEKLNRQIRRQNRINCLVVMLVVLVLLGIVAVIVLASLGKL